MTRDAKELEWLVDKFKKKRELRGGKCQKSQRTRRYARLLPGIVACNGQTHIQMSCIIA
jgi:hypothetical protein